jgi:hypothetical protein
MVTAPVVKRMSLSPDTTTSTARARQGAASFADPEIGPFLVDSLIPAKEEYLLLLAADLQILDASGRNCVRCSG